MSDNDDQSAEEHEPKNTVNTSDDEEQHQKIYTMKNALKSIEGLLKKNKIAFYKSNNGRGGKKLLHLESTNDLICVIFDDETVQISNCTKTHEIIHGLVASKEHLTKLGKNPNNKTKTSSTGMSNTGHTMDGSIKCTDGNHYIYVSSTETVIDFQEKLKRVSSFSTNKNNPLYNTYCTKFCEVLGKTTATISYHTKENSMEVTGNLIARIPYVALALLCSEQGDRWTTIMLPLVEAVITYKERNKVFISRKNGQETKVTVLSKVQPHLLATVLQETGYHLKGEIEDNKEYLKLSFDEINWIKMKLESLVMTTSGTQQMDALALLVGSMAGAKRKVFKHREDLGEIFLLGSPKYTKPQKTTSPTKLSPNKSSAMRNVNQLTITSYAHTHYEPMKVITSDESKIRLKKITSPNKNKTQGGATTGLTPKRAGGKTEDPNTGLHSEEEYANQPPNMENLMALYNEIKDQQIAAEKKLPKLSPS